jgi:anti-sigma B factor antagonist
MLPCEGYEVEIAKSQQGAVTILTLKGALTAEDVDLLDRKIDECVNAGNCKVVLEIRQVPFIDSAGLERFQGIVSQMGRAGGDVRVASVNEVCRDIFQATRMTTFVQIFDDRESAVRSLL